MCLFFVHFCVCRYCVYVTLHMCLFACVFEKITIIQNIQIIAHFANHSVTSYLIFLKTDKITEICVIIPHLVSSLP